MKMTWKNIFIRASVFGLFMFVLYYFEMYTDVFENDVVFFVSSGVAAGLSAILGDFVLKLIDKFTIS